jgi:hypothetical protein
MKNLSKLKLNLSTSSDCIPFFTNLGTSCPNLKILHLGHTFPFELNQQLALILGQRAALLPQSHPLKLLKLGVDETNLHHLQFNKEHTTPICQSLEVLYATIDCKERHLMDGEDEEMLISSRALLLRHFPRLKNCEVETRLWSSYRCPRAIQLLHDASQLSGDNITIIEMTGQVENRNGDFLRGLKWSINSPPPRKFSSHTSQISYQFVQLFL